MFNTRYIKIYGIIAILISLITWTMDFTEFTYVCIFCRTLRTLIGILGIMMVFNMHRYEFTRYLAIVLALFGAHVASALIFRHLRILHELNDWQNYDWLTFEQFIMAMGALLIIVFQAYLLNKPSPK